MKTKCPKCEASDKVPNESSGKKMQCWRCGEWYVIAEGVGTLLQQKEQKDTVPSGHTDVSTAPKGIGGWLVIPAIGLVLGPIKVVIMLFQGIIMIQSFAPELLSDARFWVSGVIDVAMVIAAIIVAILFFKERHIAVVAIISLMAASIVANAIQLFLSIAMFGKASSGGINPVLHACVFAAIWIPYFVKSKRVKNTFVN